MMFKRFIVAGLETLCGFLDNIPFPEKGDDGWGWYKGSLGCYRFRLAERSAQLDEKWKTGHWQGP